MKIQSALISIAVLFSLTLPSAAPAMEGDEADFGRISDLTGTLQVKGGYDPDWMSMGVNVPVGEGDSLWLEHGGLAEVEFPGGTRVRMQGESKLDLLELTVFPGAFSLNLEALEGRFYIRTPDQAGGEGIAPVDVKVPSARISIRPESLVRLDIESGRTRVRVQEGSVRIDPFGPGGPTPVFLGRMEQIRLSTEGDPGYPGYFTTASDDGLERYNRFRDNRFMEQDRPEPLDEPLVGQDELARNGSWVFIGGVSYWRPYVSVGWRPYSVGHWAWHTGFGWTWISGDPFGYVTFHYGRWHHDSYYGWVWFPGYTYAPAHVHWISVGPYYAWAPLGIYGYPVSTGYIHFTLHGGYGIDLNVWSYSHVDYFVGIRKHHRYSAHKHFRPVERRLFTDHPSGKVEAVGIGTRPGTAGGERSFASPGPGKKRTIIRTPDTRRKAMETEIRNRAVTPREFSKNLRPESRSFETSRQTTLIDPSRAGKQEFKQSSRPAPQIQKDTTPKSERRAAPPPELRRAPKNTDRSGGDHKAAIQEEPAPRSGKSPAFTPENRSGVKQPSKGFSPAKKGKSFGGWKKGK